ncbi:Transmembrane protein 154 [Galemys pyrenaicus]|uniref:Transmembrane protein 154 n=1 Tax=Galemys pyrenaicus TaxID=202257 RepID=A0A8J6DG97_GALPY|nr:Transmembrane protein 154 [Galemys pyrenaicus]
MLAHTMLQVSAIRCTCKATGYFEDAGGSGHVTQEEGVAHEEITIPNTLAAETTDTYVASVNATLTNEEESSLEFMLMVLVPLILLALLLLSVILLVTYYRRKRSKQEPSTQGSQNGLQTCEYYPNSCLELRRGSRTDFKVKQHKIGSDEALPSRLLAHKKLQRSQLPGALFQGPAGLNPRGDLHSFRPDDRKPPPLAQVPESGRLCKSPIFEEDTPSVMEIEMEELDKWMNSMNKNGARLFREGEGHDYSDEEKAA